MDDIEFWQDFDHANRFRDKGCPDPGSIGLMVAIPLEGDPLLYAYCDTAEDEGRIEDWVMNSEAARRCFTELAAGRIPRRHGRKRALSAKKPATAA